MANFPDCVATRRKIFRLRRFSPQKDGGDFHFSHTRDDAETHCWMAGWLLLLLVLDAVAAAVPARSTVRDLFSPTLSPLGGCPLSLPPALGLFIFTSM